MLVSTSHARSGVPLLVVAGVLWGTGGLFGSALSTTTGLGPVAVAACRLGGGGLLLCGYLLASGRSIPRSRLVWRRILGIGGLAALFQCSYFAAVAASGVSVATLVAIGIAPVVVLAVEALTRRRRVGASAVAGVALALVGLALLVGPAPTGSVVVGAALAAVAGTGFAAMTLLSGSPSTVSTRRRPPASGSSSAAPCWSRSPC